MNDEFHIAEPLSEHHQKRMIADRRFGSDQNDW